MSNNNSRPRVGVQVLVIKDEKILIGRDSRKGEDVWGVPGGNWESGETLLEAAKREVFEESGVECNNFKLINVYDFYREDKKVSYVSIGYRAEYLSGDLRDSFEEKRLDWNWMTPQEALSLNLYPAGKILIEAYFGKK